MRTLICIPCLDMVQTSFMRCLLALQGDEGEVQFAISASSLVYDARNMLANKAIDGGFDRVLWLDSDMDFSPDLLKKLSQDMNEGREFVSGLYFTRKAPHRPVLYDFVGLMKDEDGKQVRHVAVTYDNYPENDIFECEAVGFGGCMTTVALLKKVRDEFGLPFSPISGFGEDLSFCLRVRKLGVNIYCDSRVKMGHTGYKTFTEDDYVRGE